MFDLNFRTEIPENAFEEALLKEDDEGNKDYCMDIDLV